MRLFFTVLLVVMSFSFEAVAQSERSTERQIYNGGGYGSQLYNSSSSHRNRGPISLKQMLSGKKDAATGSSSGYYGGRNSRPYGMDNNSRSLSLSPSEIQASRAKRDAFARAQEKESLRQIQTAQAVGVQGQTKDFLNKFQSGSSQKKSGKVRSIYKKTRKQDFDMPSKVFNSVR